MTRRTTAVGPVGGPQLTVQDTDWIEIIGARRIGECLFAAKRRKSPNYGPPSTVAHIEFDFRQWDGPIGEWSEHFGKGQKQVHSLDGGEPLRSCQEVEVAKRLRAARDHAFWFSAFGAPPSPWRLWASTSGDTPEWLDSLDKSIRQQISSRKGGIPDVVAWNDPDPLGSAIFVECKGRGEAFKETQEDWVWAACRAGVGITQIAVSVLPF